MKRLFTIICGLFLCSSAYAVDLLQGATVTLGGTPTAMTSTEATYIRDNLDVTAASLTSTRPMTSPASKTVVYGFSSTSVSSIIIKYSLSTNSRRGCAQVRVLVKKSDGSSTYIGGANLNNVANGSTGFQTLTYSNGWTNVVGVEVQLGASAGSLTGGSGTANCYTLIANS